MKIAARGYPNSAYRRAGGASTRVRGFQDVSRRAVKELARRNARTAVAPLTQIARRTLANTALAGLRRVNPLLGVVSDMLGNVPMEQWVPWGQNKPGQPLSYNFDGWTRSCFNPQIVPAVYHGQQFACRLNGTQLETFFDEWPTGIAPPSGGRYWISLTSPKRPHPSGPPFIQYDTSEIWNRSELDGVPQPVEIPAIAPQVAPPMPAIIPRVSPAIDPLQMPIGQPVVEPRPLPYRAIPLRQPNPWRHPDEQPQRGPNGVPALPPVGVPPAGRPTERPGPRFRLRWRYLPGGKLQGRVDMHPRPQAYYATRWRGRVREQKLKVSGGFGYTISTITEFEEFVDLIWQSIPKQHKSLPMKGERLRFDRIVADIYNGWRHINWEKFSEGFFQNQIEDWIFGRVGKGLKSTYSGDFYRRLTGLQTGMSAWGAPINLEIPKHMYDPFEWRKWNSGDNLLPHERTRFGKGAMDYPEYRELYRKYSQWRTGRDRRESLRRQRKIYFNWKLAYRGAYR